LEIFSLIIFYDSVDFEEHSTDFLRSKYMRITGRSKLDMRGGRDYLLNSNPTLKISFPIFSCHLTVALFDEGATMLFTMMSCPFSRG
jgi:hypothetical protein